MSDMESRKAFEARFAHLDLSSKGDASGGYEDWTTQFRWRGWSARDAEIEALKAERDAWKNEAYLANAHQSLDHLLDENTALKDEIEPLRKWYADSHRIIDVWDTKCSALKEKLKAEDAEVTSLLTRLSEVMGENVALKARVEGLKKALVLSCKNCECLHHEKKHQHKSGEPCPVEKIIQEALR